MVQYLISGLPVAVLGCGSRSTLLVGEKWLTIHWPGSPSLGQVASWNQRRDPWNKLPATPLPTPGQNSSGRISPEQGGVLPAPPFAFSPPRPAGDPGL